MLFVIKQGNQDSTASATAGTAQEGEAAPLAAWKSPAGCAYSSPGPRMPPLCRPSFTSTSCVALGLSLPLFVSWFPSQQQEQGLTHQFPPQDICTCGSPGLHPDLSKGGLLLLQDSAQMPSHLEAPQPPCHCPVTCPIFSKAHSVQNHLTIDSSVARPSPGMSAPRRQGVCHIHCCPHT